MHVPSTAFVEKNATFLVSNGLSLVKSADRVCGSDSPVKDELSTCEFANKLNENCINKVRSSKITNQLILFMNNQSDLSYSYW